ncbi:unnamed protein product, partial [Musa banksii]
MRWGLDYSGSLVPLFLRARISGSSRDLTTVQSAPSSSHAWSTATSFGGSIFGVFLMPGAAPWPYLGRRRIMRTTSFRSIVWSEGDGGDVGGAEGGQLGGLLDEAGPPLLERGAPCPRVGDELHRPLHLCPKRDRERERRAQRRIDRGRRRQTRRVGERSRKEDER